MLIDALRYHRGMSFEPRIILLNGSSSSGKTTLALALQQLLTQELGQAFQHIALDQFRDGMPGKWRGFNSPPGTPGAQGLNIVPRERDGERVTCIEFGEQGEVMLAGMRRAIAAFARAGNHVIVDDLLFKPGYLDDYVAAFEDIPTWFVGVRCELSVVQERELTRPGRFPGTAESHFDAVHAHGMQYDIEIDTSNKNAHDCAELVLARLATPPLAFAERRAR